VKQMPQAAKPGAFLQKQIVVAAAKSNCAAIRKLFVLAYLIANHTTYGCTTNRAQYAAASDHRTRDAAQARAGYRTFLTVTHIVPRRTTAQGQNQNTHNTQFA